MIGSERKMWKKIEKCKSVRETKRGKYDRKDRSYKSMTWVVAKEVRSGYGKRVQG